MNCNVSKEKLIGYLYREMEAGELAEMERHVGECPACRKELDELSETARVLQAWPAENPGIKTVFVPEKISRRSPVWDWLGATAGRRRGFAAAAMLAMVLVTFGVLKYDRQFNRNISVMMQPESQQAPVFTEDTGANYPLAHIHGQGNAANAPNEDQILKDIDVMANIMDQAFDRQYQQFFERRGRTHGVYVNGLGPVFVVKDGANDSFQNADVNRILNKLQANRTWQFSAPSPQVWQPQHPPMVEEDFPTVLLEIVGEYGHTLRPLYPAESIVVAVELDKDRAPQPFKSNRFLIKVKKKDIDAYNRGLIELVDFRKMVEVQEY